MARESLSALMDGECTPAETERLLAAIERSPELQQEWSRLCLAREAREGTRIGKHQACICGSVMAALDDLPEAAAQPKVIELASRRMPAKATHFWKPLAGLAVAASVAAVAMLVTVPGKKALTVESGNSLTPQITAPVSFPGIRRYNRNLQAVALRPEELEQREELNNLLLEHNGSMAEQGMSGTLRYARFAAHTAEYRPQQQSVGDQR